MFGGLRIYRVLPYIGLKDSQRRAPLMLQSHTTKQTAVGIGKTPKCKPPYSIIAFGYGFLYGGLAFNSSYET